MKHLINKVNQMDAMDLLKQIPDKSIDMIMADPPYYKIKGDFDWAWDNFEDYLKDVEKWAVECKRVLKENGTLFWFGDEKNIAYTQIIFDKYFGLLNNLVWWKYNLRGGAFGSSGGDLIRSFPICTERILVYSNDVYNLTQCVYSTRDYIREEIIKAKGKIILKDVNIALGTASNGGGVASSCLSIKKTEPTMFTKEMYKKLKSWLGKDYLRREYEDLRREFNNKYNLTEVLEYKTNKKHYIEHDTVKPVDLISSLIETCSRDNNLILDPFMGSWTTAVACQNLKRNFIGCELDESYCEIGKQRLRQQTLL